METLVHAGLSNALAATILAVLVASVTHFCRRPALVHSFWLLVLLRLLMPPVLAVGIPWPNLVATPNTEGIALALTSDPVPETERKNLPEVSTGLELGHAEDLPIVPSSQTFRGPERGLTTPGSSAPMLSPLAFWEHALFTLWLAGSIVWLVLACWRLYRFGKLLRYAQPATPSQQEQVRRLAGQLGLRRCPSVWFMPATVSPMLCALIGAPRLFIPAVLWDGLSDEQRDTLLIHELAHLRRRDQWVRQLEFVVTALYWWHPILWWARRQIQEAEEQCCDAWVVSLAPAAIPAYAETLVATVAFLSRARPALPLGASGMGHARLLRRRLTMILRGTTPTGLSAAGFAAVVVLGAVALPLLPAWTQPSASPAHDAILGENVIVENAQQQEPDAGIQALGSSAEPVKAGRLSGGELPQLPTEVKPAEKIQMTKRDEPWPTTLNWLADQTGMGVTVSVWPTDEFTFIAPPGKDSYTIPEVVDILNEQLMGQTKPCLLIRGVRQWRLVPLPTNANQRLDPALLPRVTKDMLKEHGETEIVSLHVQLEVLSADDIAAEYAKTSNNLLKRLMAPYGDLLSIPGSNQLVLRDTVANLKNVVQLLEAAEKAEKQRGIVRHTCKWIRASEAEKRLKELLGVAPAGPPMGDPRNPRMPQPKPGQPGGAAGAQDKVYVTSDDGTNQVFVSGPPNKLDQAKRALAEMDVQKNGQAPIQVGPRTYRTYGAPGGNADALVKSLEKIYGKSPSVAISALGKDQIMVLAFPADHAAIRKLIEGSKEELVTEQINLNFLDPKHAVDTLNALFGRLRSVPVPTLAANLKENAIIVRGTPEQIKAVEEALKKLDARSTSPADGEQRMKRLEDKLDTLLKEVEALRKERRSESPGDRRQRQ